MTYESHLTAELLDTDGTTVIADALVLATRPRFMDELDGTGTGSISIGFYDANVSDLIDKRFVRVYSNGVEAFTFLIEGDPQYAQLKEGGHVEEIITASGRGWTAIFERGIVAPEPLLVGVDLDTSYRHWTFASINFPNAGAWGPAQELYEYRDGIDYGLRVDAETDPGADPDSSADDVVKLYPAPIGFPWPNAPKNGNGFAPTPTYEGVYWVRADGAAEDDVGFDFFRGYVTLAGQQAITFHGTADNLYKYWLDGVPIFEEQEDKVAWLRWKDVTLELPAGTHVLAYNAENIDAPELAYNPGGSLFDAIAISVYPGDVETTLTLKLLASSAADLPESFFSPDTWPGWSPPQIIRDFIGEVQTRGGLDQYVGDGFLSDTEDSNGDEFTSSDPDFVGPYVPTFSLKINDTVLDCLNQLHQQGWLRWHGRPDTFELQGWGGASAIGTDSGAVFSIANKNIRGLERGQSKPYANALLTQWANGFVWVVDQDEIDDNGRFEEGFVSNAGSRADAISDATVELKRRPADAAEAIMIEIEPRNSGEAPYEGFTVGDYITVPNKTGGSMLVQVMSIQPDTDDENRAFWRLECNARWPSPERSHEDLLRLVGGKTYGDGGTRGVVYR